jgi:O-antigen/teichoic acid export membrane protein
LINRNSNKASANAASESRQFLKGTAWNLTGSFAFAFSAWLTTFIIAKYYGAGQYYNAGVFAVAASFGNIFRIVSSYGLRAYQVSDTGGDSSDWTYIVSRAVTVLLGAVLCLMTSLAFGYDATQILAINIYMAFQSVCAFADVLFGILQRHGRIDRSGISLTIRGVVTTAAFTLCLLLTGNLLLSLGAISISALLVLLLYDIPVTKRYNLPAIHWADFLKPEPYKLLKLGFPMLLYTVFITLITFAPRLLLEKISGASAVGVFAYVFAPTVVISTFASGVLLPFITKMTDFWNTNNIKKLCSAFFAAFGLILFAGVCGVGFSMLFGRWLLTLLYDAMVGEHTRLLVIAVFASTLLSLCICCNNIFIVARRMKTLTALNAAGLLLTVVGCLLLIPRYGMYGAGYAMVAGLVVQLLITGGFLGALLIKKKRETALLNTELPLVL